MGSSVLACDTGGTTVGCRSLPRRRDQDRYHAGYLCPCAYQKIHLSANRLATSRWQKWSLISLFGQVHHKTFPSFANRVVADIGTQTPATFNTWLVVQNDASRIFSVPIPKIDPTATFTLPLNTGPIGNVGVLTTLTNSRGITCSVWKRVSTGQPGGISKIPDAALIEPEVTRLLQ